MSAGDPDTLAILAGSLVSAYRAAAAEALGLRTDEASFLALVAALKDTAESVRLEVERALARRAEPDASERIARRVPDPCAAARILAARTDAVADRETLAALAGPAARAKAAIEGLGTRKDARSLELLAETWEHHAELRREAGWALLGSDLAAIAPLLMRGLDRRFAGADADGPGRLPVRALALQPDFVERAMALLQPDATWTRFERRRAELLLFELEERLAQDADEETDPKKDAPSWSRDPRWLELAQTLAESPDAPLAEQASYLARALLFRTGREVVVRVLHACLPEHDQPFGPPYPLVALGWSVPLPVALDERSEERAAEQIAAELIGAGLFPPHTEGPVNESAERGPRLSLFAHQYGGLACFQAHVLGLGLDLPARDEGQLQALAQQWWGAGPFISGPSPEWQEALGPQFPPLVRAEEAFLETEPVPSLEAFEGVEVLEVRSRTMPWRASRVFMGDAVAHRVGGLGRAHLALLSGLSARFGRAPSLFWFASNSD